MFKEDLLKFHEIVFKAALSSVLNNVYNMSVAEVKMIYFKIWSVNSGSISESPCTESDHLKFMSPVNGN